jgi:hypothetical protein
MTALVAVVVMELKMSKNYDLVVAGLVALLGESASTMD